MHPERETEPPAAEDGTIPGLTRATRQASLMANVAHLVLRLMGGHWQERVGRDGGAVVAFVEGRLHFNQDVLDVLRAVLLDLIELNASYGPWIGRPRSTWPATEGEDVELRTLYHRVLQWSCGSDELLELTGIKVDDRADDLLRSCMEACFLSSQAFNDWATEQLVTVEAHRSRLSS